MRIGITESIAAPAESIFNLTQDYGTRLSWDPFLRQAILLDDAKSAGLGIRSWCVAWFGVGMESEYVSFTPPKVVAVKMTRGPWMLERFAASWRFHSAKTDRTDVSFVYSFQMRPSIRVLTPVVAALFRYEMRQRLLHLKRACEAAYSGAGAK